MPPMTREHRVRAWLVTHQPALDELRSAEIRLAVAVDALRRATRARHADTTDLLAQTAAAADELAQRAASVLALPEMPLPHGQLFLHDACQRFTDIAEQLNTTNDPLALDDLPEAAQEIRIGRSELDKALEIITDAARLPTML